MTEREQTLDKAVQTKEGHEIKGAEHMMSPEGLPTVQGQETWPKFDPTAPVPPGPAGSALAEGTLASPKDAAEKNRWIIRLKWYYLLTAGLGVLTLFFALYGATEVQNQYQAGRPPSPLAFFLPFLGIGGLSVVLYVGIDALCAFLFRPKTSSRRLHFILNLLLYLAIVLGWPVAIATWETFR